VGAVAVAVSHADGRLVVEAADSGIGIPADKLEAVFDRFVQGDASLTRRAGGTGLGLAICRSLAELMGGTIAVSSAPGKGSVFTVSLDLPRTAQVSAPPSAPEPVPQLAAIDEVRILAAEDNEVNRVVLSTLLSQVGVALTLAENGAEALEAWRAGDFDLVLMDIQMPVMDGLTATGLMRVEEAAGGRRRTPIVALTANAMPHQCAEYRRAGMDLVIAKPLQAAQLFEAVERAVAGELRAAEVA
jgi:two-component system, sensor histidine kinase